MMIRNLLLFFALGSLFAQRTDPLISSDFEAQKQWVDSIYQNLSLDEKIGQLFMVMVFSEHDSLRLSSIINDIKKHAVGGVIFSRGTPLKQARLTNHLQAQAKVPLLIGIDGEWGLAMRLQQTQAFPFNMTLGAIQQDSLLYRLGQQMGLNAKRLGVHINFAPVLDINTNPKNPIIGSRSFGETKEIVTNKALMVMKGMQNVGLLTSGKHFPGHGDTSTDSHKTLPTVRFSKKRLKNTELYPYKKLISEGMTGVMVAHLEVPALEPHKGVPSSMSDKVVSKLLKNELGFEGLVITDALNMQGALSDGSGRSPDLTAFLAGSDLLLIPNNLEAAVGALKTAYLSGEISEDRLAYSVKKILKAKHKVGLHKNKMVNTKQLQSDLNSEKGRMLFRELTEKSMIVLKNDQELIPIKALQNHKIAYVSMGAEQGDTFYDMLQHYTQVDYVSASTSLMYKKALTSYNTVVVGIHQSDENPWKSYKLSTLELEHLRQMAKEKNVILCLFAKPYALSEIDFMNEIETVLVAHQNNEVSQQTAAQVLFGGLGASGRLPVTAHSRFPVGSGLNIKPLDRLSYGHPLQVGLDPIKLNKVDSLVQTAVDSLMTPGVQLLIARHGKVVVHKMFGKPTYESKNNVEWNQLYDLASMTKILASLPLFMKLYEKHPRLLDSPLSKWLPRLKGTNKAALTAKEILSHYGKLTPWIPFYLETIDSITHQPLPALYRSDASLEFPIKVADQLYLHKSYIDSIETKIDESNLLDKLEYRYSDLAFYLIKDIVETHEKVPIEKLFQQNFTASMGAQFTTFNPLIKFSKSQIIPSENDTYFRHQTLQGYVHDMGAAMLGGVAGHAGLFANANDVAKFMQLFLQKGHYGGKRYFSDTTFDTFNKCYYCDQGNRRGVGLDKPQLEEEGPTCGCVSMDSYGHSGFTGTYTWADPETDLIYVFLSNRTYPTMENNKLIETNLRTKIQGLIYNALIN